ncbi:hypothetical protein PR048_005267 [Dryococelus australis]|uniref:Uncharacterized protein n=1 Tax=Dryococelus australis TaxID=614101 RepID=A0ABQ9I8M4_9NEOP|nr:hypothetical protein PR048_005267 [Dryococelus australis]
MKLECGKLNNISYMTYLEQKKRIGFLLQKLCVQEIPHVRQFAKPTLITSSNSTPVRVVVLFLMATPAQQTIPTT